MWRFVGGRLATDFSKNCRGFVFKEPEKNILQVMVCCRFVGLCIVWYRGRVLRRIFGYKRDWVTGEWRELHNEELNDLYCSPNIIRVTKSRRMRWAGHVARMGERRGVYRVLVGREGKKTQACMGG